MSSGIYIATAGARAQSDALDSIANNVANVNTTGYQAQRVAFSEALATAQSPDARFVGVGETSVDTSAGAVRSTGNELDLALSGEGYLAIKTPQGERFTRAGDFRLDEEGVVVNSSGHAALSTDGDILEVPAGASSITVGADGTVSADGIEVGTLKLARFDEESLQREGGSLFAAQGDPLEGVDLPKVTSGTLEGSNYNAVRGVVNMVKVSRTYQALLKMIEGYKAVDGRAARDLGGPK